MAENAPRSFAPQEFIDGLKLKYEIAPPELIKLIPFIVGKSISAIWNKYSPYIPIETSERLQHLDQRVIVTNNSNFDELTRDFRGRNSSNADGIFTFDGNYIVIKNPSDMEYVWDQFSADVKPGWIRVHKSEEKAKKFLGEERFGKVLIHELLHGFHRNDIDAPLVFLENGVNYYAREVATELGITELGLFEQWEADTYAVFLKKQGPKVHSVFFGSEVKQEQIAAIMEEYRKLVARPIDEIRAEL